MSLYHRIHRKQTHVIKVQGSIARGGDFFSQLHRFVVSVKQLRKLFIYCPLDALALDEFSLIDILPLL